MIRVHELDTMYDIEGYGSFVLQFNKKDLETVIKYTKEIILKGHSSHYGILTLKSYGYELKDKLIFFGNYIDTDDKKELYNKLSSLHMPKTLSKDDINEWLGVKRFSKKKFRDKLSTLSLSSVDRIYQLRKEGNNETSSSRQK